MSLYPDNYENINQKTKILNLRKIKTNKNSLKKVVLFIRPKKKTCLQNKHKILTKSHVKYAITEYTKKRDFTQNTHKLQTYKGKTNIDQTQTQWSDT